MSLDIKITKPLEQGLVQVNATYKDGYTRYYSVPRNNAKKFANELKIQEKDNNLYTNIAYFGTIFTGVLGGAIISRNMNNWLNKFLIQFSAAIGLYTAATLVMNKFNESKEKKLMQKYKAKEIFYEI